MVANFSCTRSSRPTLWSMMSPWPLRSSLHETASNLALSLFTSSCTYHIAFHSRTARASIQDMFCHALGIGQLFVVSMMCSTEVFHGHLVDQCSALCVPQPDYFVWTSILRKSPASTLDGLGHPLVGRDVVFGLSQYASNSSVYQADCQCSYLSA